MRLSSAARAPATSRKPPPLTKAAELELGDEERDVLELRQPCADPSPLSRFCWSRDGLPQLSLSTESSGLDDQKS